MGELATEPEEKEAREMVAGAELEAKPLVHPLGKLVSSPGSVPVTAKEFVLRAGKTQIPPSTEKSWGRQYLRDVFVALRSFINYKFQIPRIPGPSDGRGFR